MMMVDLKSAHVYRSLNEVFYQNPELEKNREKVIDQLNKTDYYKDKNTFLCDINKYQLIKNEYESFIMKLKEVFKSE